MKAIKRKPSHPANNYDLYEDIEKIKSVLADVTQDIRGKAGEMFSDSVDDIRKKTAAVKENVADYTAESPFKTLSLTLLAGLMIGYFLRR